MARKEINIFGTSFLDLLSGALAAVIILYIIVPKISQSDRDVIDEIQQMDIQVEELARQIEALQNMISPEAYDQIVSRIEQLQSTITQLETDVSNLQDENTRLSEENQRLRERAAMVDSLQRRLQQLERDQTSRSGMMFGMDAELGIVCSWEEDCDVDLYVTDLSTGVICCFNKKITPFGNLMEDVMSHREGDDRYELFYQKHITPGRYRISVKIYDTSHGPANVSGYIVMHPGSPNEIKIPYSGIRLPYASSQAVVGILTVQDNNISLQR